MLPEAPVSGRGWPFQAFLSTYSHWAQLSLCCSHPDLILSWCCSVAVSLPSAPLSPSAAPEVFLGHCPPPTSMSASLPATLNPAQKVRIFPVRTWGCVALLCFALQSATCLNRKNPQDCGDKTPCTEEEPEQAGCPQGRGWD